MTFQNQVKTPVFLFKSQTINRYLLQPSLLLRALLAIILTTGGLLAAPYGPEGRSIEWVQPDGAKLSLRVYGDEFHARTETTDGYTVVRNSADNAYY
ncbi:MAG: hypothetical protein ACI9E1_001195 [Cryomorphaceae bacterium]|jgi:hypothetical protein